MAIINCPACGKRISSVAVDCQFCKTDFSSENNKESQIRANRNMRFRKNQRLQNFSFLLIVLFTAGAILMYFGITDQDETLNTAGRVIVAFGFVGYIIARILLMINRKK